MDAMTDDRSSLGEQIARGTQSLSALFAFIRATFEGGEMKHVKLLLALTIVVMLVAACAPAATPVPPTSAPQPAAPASAPAQPTAVPPTSAPPPTAVPPTATKPAPTTAPVAAGPRILKLAATASVTTWDPSTSFSTEALYMANLYEPLLWVNPPNAKDKYTPALAEKWDHSADGTTWTFTLRKGVKFHDGTALTAEAVTKSISRTITLDAGAAFIWAPVAKMETPDPQTVVFRLKYAAPMELIAGSTYGAWIYSPKAVEAANQDPKYFEKGLEAGTGPYKMESYTAGKEVVLTKFDDYWGGWKDVAHFDKVVVSITPEAVTQQQMLEGGQVDLALSLPLENIKRFKDNASFTVSEEPSLMNYVGYLNTKRPPLDNKLVRQAIAYAIPYNDIVAVGPQGFGTQARSVVPKGVWPYSEDVFQYKSDLAKAKDLMKQAGLDGKTFNLTLTYAAENQNEERFAPLVKDALKPLGFNVEIKPMLWTQQWKLAKDDPTKAQDIFLLLYWPTYSDAGTDNLFSMMHSEKKPFFNLGYYSNPDFDKLIDDAAAIMVTDPKKSQEMYTKAMNLAADDSPVLAFYDLKQVNVVPKSLQGFQYNMNYPFSTFFYPLYKK
jgi:peptide/nickel transport system substrate-binding protein